LPTRSSATRAPGTTAPPAGTWSTCASTSSKFQSTFRSGITDINRIVRAVVSLAKDQLIVEKQKSRCQIEMVTNVSSDNHLAQFYLLYK
jgi:hypothetical protein